MNFLHECCEPASSTSVAYLPLSIAVPCFCSFSPKSGLQRPSLIAWTDFSCWIARLDILTPDTNEHVSYNKYHLSLGCSTIDSFMVRAFQIKQKQTYFDLYIKAVLETCSSGFNTSNAKNAVQQFSLYFSCWRIRKKKHAIFLILFFSAGMWLTVYEKTTFHALQQRSLSEVKRVQTVLSE